MQTLTADELARLAAARDAALGALLSLQKPGGHFCGELEGDSILESEYLLMKFILHQEDQPMHDGRDGRETLAKIADCLRDQQRSDGSWGQYPGAATDLSATVKAYLALKLMGDKPRAPHMTAAREVILKSGGAERCNSFSNFYLACLGQIPWRAVPAIPPQIVLLPRWFYFHMTKVSAWTRTMILPLAIVSTLRPTRRLPPEMGIDELFVDDRARRRLKLVNKTPWHWEKFFLAVDWLLKFACRAGLMPLRGRSLRLAERWMLDRAGQDGARATSGLGAIFPPMVYIQIALRALGYPRTHPVVQRAERELDELFIEENGQIRIQPCFSPVWDTGIALYALTDCGMTADDGSVARAASWLLSKECRHVGDWAANVAPPAHRLPTCGWFFEYNNAWYPDCDDTAMVAMALRRAGGAENLAAGRRGVQWLLAMQNDDGGWAAFDRTRHRRILEYIPFADHNAMQDPSCPDITGRVLECLAWHGLTIEHPAVRRAIQYIKSHQIAWRDDPRVAAGLAPRGREAADDAPRFGCWFGRWGVNYIYGTWQAVIGPIRCGAPRNDDWIARAARWIKAIQKPDGSFGESADSYENPALKGRGPSTASQTAWAAMILLEICGPDDPALKRAIDWLAQTQLTDEQAADRAQNPDGDPPGSWREDWFTGTGFPRVFYLRYHLYRLYFPLMAIGRYLAARKVPSPMVNHLAAEIAEGAAMRVASTHFGSPRALRSPR